MDHRTKGFTLIELLVALAILVILITLAVPAFTRSVQSSQGRYRNRDLQRALNFARLEAIDRGSTTRFRPSGRRQRLDRGTDGLRRYWHTGQCIAGCSGDEQRRDSDANLRRDCHRFQQSRAVCRRRPRRWLISYVLGAQSRTLNVCLNGRILLGGSCG